MIFSLWIWIDGQEELHVTRVTMGNAIVLEHLTVLLKMALTAVHSNAIVMDQLGQKYLFRKWTPSCYCCVLSQSNSEHTRQLELEALGHPSNMGHYHGYPESEGSRYD